MIVEMRTYQLKPPAAHEFVKAEGFAIQKEAWGNPLGYFVSEVGELNRVVHLSGFDSFDDRQIRRSKLAASEERRAFVSKTLQLVVSQRTGLLSPTAFSPIR